MLERRKNFVLLPLQARPVFLSIFEMFSIFDPFQKAKKWIRPVLCTLSKAPKKINTPEFLTKEN